MFLVFCLLTKSLNENLILEGTTERLYYVERSGRRRRKLYLYITILLVDTRRAPGTAPQQNYPSRSEAAEYASEAAAAPAASALSGPGAATRPTTRPGTGTPPADTSYDKHRKELLTKAASTPPHETRPSPPSASTRATRRSHET